MFKSFSDPLFSLIKSLNKAEKRNFSIYVGRFTQGPDAKFLLLFQLIEKQKTYNEKEIRKKMSIEHISQLANLKRHLYAQILVSLRLILTHKHIDLQIREQIDFARILYIRGLYMQSLHLLEKIKNTAVANHQDVLHLEILEFQKMIETRHITRSRQVINKMESLLEETARRSSITHSNSRLSNLTIQIHGWYIEKGHALNREEQQKVKNYFLSQMPKDLKEAELTFFEKINLYQATAWFHYTLLDLPAAIRQARLWVQLFQSNQHIQKQDPDLYLRGLYYLLIFLFLQKNLHEFRVYYQVLNQFITRNEAHFTFSSNLLAFQYRYLSALNLFFLNRKYEDAKKWLQEKSEELPKYSAYMDTHRVLLFHYKAAYIYFVCGDYSKTLDQLNSIIHQQHKFLRTDLHFNSRLLHLLCHYELGNYDFSGNLLLSIQRTFAPSNEITPMQRFMLKLIKGLINSPLSEAQAHFIKMKKALEVFDKDLKELRSVAYLNFPAWLESKITGKSMKDILD
jgi:hypothetical protein